MIELIWSPRSIADLEEIRRTVPERQSPELREVVSGHFRIVYRRRPTKVEIATVFRGTRDLSALGL